MNYLPGLASNRDPPDLCLLSSWDYRCQPLASSANGMCFVCVSVYWEFELGLSAC
jgi:hypothetical protein